jgi:ribosome-binding protein aMBF1 (putative translation factor)
MNKDRTKVIERILARIKSENRQFVRKNLEISCQISYILEKRGWSQKDLAEKLEVSESEISKILSGLQDITLKTLSKIEVVLGEKIIDTPRKAPQ